MTHAVQGEILDLARLLRRSGFTYKEIAKIIGMSKEWCFIRLKDVKVEKKFVARPRTRKPKGIPPPLSTTFDFNVPEIFKENSKWPDGTGFTRIPVHREITTWDIFCPICSEDEYSKAGTCTGVFRVQESSLREGYKPCRCKRHPVLTEKQMEFKLKTILSRNNLEFISWFDDFKNQNSKLYLKCNTHNRVLTNVRSVIESQIKCPLCTRRGYKKHLKGYLYVLKIHGLKCSFTGYGITNNTDTRLREHSRELAKEGLSIDSCVVLEGDGDFVAEVEQKIRGEFEWCCSGRTKGFLREATTYQNYLAVVEYCSSMLNNVDN